MKKKTRTLALSTTAVISATLPPSYVLAQTFTGDQVSNGPFSGGTQIFENNSRLDAIKANTITAGIQAFKDNSTLNANASNAIAGGDQLFSENSVLNASASTAIRNSNQYFDDNSSLNITSAKAVTDGSIQTFNDNSTLNAKADNAIAGGMQIFKDSSTLQVSASKAISAGTQTFQHTSALRANATNSIEGGTQTFNNSSTLHASASKAINNGAQNFHHTSVLNATQANAISGGNQTFDGDSILNVSVTGAVSGGTQRFEGSSTVNATAPNALQSTSQSFHANSALNAAAENTLNTGTRSFYNTSVLNAKASNAITGGTLLLLDQSTLNATAANAISGGSQRFNNSSSLNASVAYAINGGTQSFYGANVLNASAANAISGGKQSFTLSGTLNASVSDAIRGGEQNFNGNSTLNASATNAVNTSTALAFSSNSTLNILANDALAPTTALTFNKTSSSIGGNVLLNGFNNSLSAITSLSDGSGRIANSSTSDSLLTLHGSAAKPSVFSGTIEDGGTGKLKLALTGGSLTLTGSASHTGGTTVADATLVVGNLDGRGTLAGPVYIAVDSTLQGTGTLTGPVTVDGTIKTGISPTTFLFGDSLNLSTSSSSVFELNSPAIVGGIGVEGNDLIEVQGELSLHGSLFADVAAAGYYRLFNYGTLAAGSGYSSEQITARSRTDFSIANYEVRYDVPGEVNLIVLGTNQTMQFWDGSTNTGNAPATGGSGVWQGFNTNWILEGTPPQPNTHTGWMHSVGIFGGTAGTVTVQGTQLFDTLQFSSDGYRIQGDALAIEASNGGTFSVDDELTATIASTVEDHSGNTLVKVGGGTLVLTGTNTYTGGTRFLGGTTSVANDNNLGHASGALYFDGGLLQITGTQYTTTNRDITIDSRGGAIDVADANNTFTLHQNITGTGSLLKRGAGTLVLHGNNHYKNTYVQTGTLVADVNALSGNISNSGTLVFNQTEDASFEGNISGFLNKNGTMVKQGIGTLSLTGTSLLDWRISDGTLAASMDKFAGNAHIDGSSSTLRLTGGNAAQYDGKISGSGQLHIASAGTTLLTGDSSAFTGHTHLNNGTLIVGDSDGNGALGGSVHINQNTTLRGAGTIGSGNGSTVTIASGGSLIPGSPHDAMNINGDIVFESGSRFVVTVDPQGTDSSLVNVTGNATLNGGTVAHVGASGDYNPRSSYTILAAKGSLSGRFDQVTSDFAFLTPTLTYNPGAGTVDLALSRNETDFTSVALTRNEIATAGAINSIGMEAGNAVYDAIVQLPDDTALIRASFNALSGEIYGSAKTALIEESRFVRHAANNRLRYALDSHVSATTNSVAYGQAQTPVQVAANHAGLTFWGQGFGSWGSTSSDGNAARLSRDYGGFLIGADTVAGDWRVGALVGYSHSSFKAKQRDSSGKSDNVHLGLYAGRQWDNLAVRAGAAYTWHHLRANRSISIPGLTEQLRGTYNAGTFQAFGEVGYGVAIHALRLEPFANLSHVHLHTEGFNEKGGEAALRVRSQNTNTTFSTLGLRAEHTMPVGNLEATLKGTLGWRHAYGNSTPESTHAFSAGNAFTIAGVPIAKNSALIEAGVDLRLSPLSILSISWEGQQASKARDNSVRLNFSTQF